MQSQYLTDITDVAGPYFNSAALKNDGTVWCWGINEYGQLGDGTTTNNYIPMNSGIPFYLE